MPRSPTHELGGSTASVHEGRRSPCTPLQAVGTRRSKVEKVADIDRLIGARIRELRQSAGATLENLAEQIGVTYQQLQKYESGANRVSASRLWRLATALDVPVGAFFPARETEHP